MEGPQTSRRICRCVRTRPALAISSASSLYSIGVRWTSNATSLHRPRDEIDVDLAEHDRRLFAACRLRAPP